MKKEIKARIKFKIPGGSATPAPPVGSMMGQHGLNIMDFCKRFNAETANRKGEIVPVAVTVYTDKTFDFVVKTASTTDLIKKAAGIQKGSSRPNTDKVAKITWRAIEEIAKIKLPDLNAVDMAQARKTIAGSARSMGIEVID
jgi:large subunit ribosomal protein L11